MMEAVRWTPDPASLLGLLVLGAAYGRGVVRVGGPGRGPLTWPRVLLFGLGWLILAAALVSPLEALAELLLAAHMAQHVLLVVSPLALAGGRAVTGVLLGFDRSLRPVLGRRLRRWSRRLVPSRAVAAALLVIATAVWHVPALYQMALDSTLLHVAEHLTYLAAASLFWASVFGEGRERRLQYGASLLAVAAVGLVGTAVGAILTFSTRPWYPRYAASAEALGVDWLVDQQTAGLVMWVPMGLVMLGVLVRLAGGWLGEVERRAFRARRIS